MDYSEIALAAGTALGFGIVGFAVLRATADMMAHAEPYQASHAWNDGREPWLNAAAPSAPANENTPTLTVNQCAVLCEMDGEFGRTAKRLVERTGLSHQVVTEVRRELRNMGMAVYGPLFDQDTGVPCGSGYILTREGVDIQRRLLDSQAVAA